MFLRVLNLIDDRHASTGNIAVNTYHPLVGPFDTPMTSQVQKINPKCNRYQNDIKR